MNYKALGIAFLFLITFNTGADATTVDETAVCIYSKSDDISSRPEKRRIRRQRGKSQIRDLKSGTLLVRLKADEKRIEAFEKKGDFAKAEKVRKFRRDCNLRVVQAFAGNYKYSKTLFFISYDSEKVKNGQFDGIFVNDSLEVDTSIILDTKKAWFIGEFDVIEADTAKHRESTYWNPNTKRLEYTYWSSSSNFSRRALIVRDKNFIQLRRPFPYYVSSENEDTADPLVKTSSHIIKRPIEEAVKKLDEKLNRKYNRFFK
jgi:hypothetical protein